ncbi:MAG: marR 2 [Thermoleophilia bacterium]|nr:marR 2 [Thermoleophilia bacterium]
MEHVFPSAASCADLLRALPGITALRKGMSRVTPAESRVWLPVLFAVTSHPEGLRMGALADELRVDQSVASRQFARIESAGLAHRGTDPTDGRAQLLRATDAGIAWVDEAVTAYSVPLATMLPGWSDGDVAELTRMLLRLGTTLSLDPTHAAPVELGSPITDEAQEASA